MTVSYSSTTWSATAYSDRGRARAEQLGVGLELARGRRASVAGLRRGGRVTTKSVADEDQHLADLDDLVVVDVAQRS